MDFSLKFDNRLLGGGYILICLLLSYWILESLGSPVKLRPFLAISLLLIFLIPTKKIYNYVVKPFFILVSLYSPFGLFYGAFDVQAFLSLYSTTLAESLEFVSQIPVFYFLSPLVAWIFLIIAYHLSTVGDIKPWRNKVAILFSVVTLAICTHPTSFFKDSYRSVRDGLEGMEELKSLIATSSWDSPSHQIKNKDYVLIIGESARKDYFNAYGYSVENTPFINTVPGIVIDGLTSGGTYTIGSLRMMLTDGKKGNDISTWEPRWDKNIIGLANQAGINTYWISNQGYIGEFDTPVSSVGEQAKHKFFLNKGGYSKSNKSDFILLDEFKEVVSEDPQGVDRLIVLHTLGSHPDACDRIREMVKPYHSKDGKYDYLACYVSSIKYTDTFLKEVHGILTKNSGRDFSMIYISDHGMVHDDRGSKIYLNNSRVSLRHYDIPLILIDSSIKEHKFLRSSKSGLNFTQGLASWMNIESADVEGYDLFDGKSDKNDYGLAKYLQQKARDVADDPALDIGDFIE